MTLAAIIAAIYPDGAVYSTHQLNDDNNLARMFREQKPHVIWEDTVLEWLDERPIPTKAELEAKKTELEGAA